MRTLFLRRRPRSCAKKQGTLSFVQSLTMALPRRKSSVWLLRDLPRCFSSRPSCRFYHFIWLWCTGISTFSSQPCQHSLRENIISPVDQLVCHILVSELAP